VPYGRRQWLAKIFGVSPQVIPRIVGSASAFQSHEGHVIGEAQIPCDEFTKRRQAREDRLLEDDPEFNRHSCTLEVEQAKNCVVERALPACNAVVKFGAVCMDRNADGEVGQSSLGDVLRESKVFEKERISTRVLGRKRRMR